MILQRGRRWGVTVYDSTTQGKRWVGTFDTPEQAREAEFTAKIGNKPRRAWLLETKGESACRNCGALAIVLHHIVPRAFCVDRETADDPWFNALPLCTRCHVGWHTRTVRISADKLLPEERGFVAGTLGLDWLDGNYPHGGRLNVNWDLMEEVKQLRADLVRVRDGRAA